MNRILTSNISDSAGLPILGRTLDFIQDSFVNQDLSLLYGQINKENTTDLLFIYGGIITLGVGTISITKGMVQYGNELYQVDAQTYTYTTLSNVGLNFIDTWQSGEPTTYTDSVTRNTNRIRKLSFSESPLGGINYLSFKYLNRLEAQTTVGSGLIASSITVVRATSLVAEIYSIKKGNIINLFGFFTCTSNNTTAPIVTVNLNSTYHYDRVVLAPLTYIDLTSGSSFAGIVSGDTGTSITFNLINATTISNQYNIFFNITFDALNIG